MASSNETRRPIVPWTEWVWLFSMFCAIGSLPAFIYCIATFTQSTATDVKRNYTIGMVISATGFVISCVYMVYYSYVVKPNRSKVSPSSADTQNGKTLVIPAKSRRTTTIVNNTTNITTCSGWTLLCCCVRSDIETGN